MSKDFFISYNSADRKWAVWIAWILEKAGYEIVIQEWDFRPGSNWVIDMYSGLKETGRVIAVLSKDFLEAEYTQPEWAKAFADDPKGEKRKLIPIKVGKCEPESLLKTIIYIDIIGMTGKDAERKILAGVSDQERVKPSKKPPFPAGRKKPPYPGAEPEVEKTSNLPSRNPNFTGRIELIRGIEKTLGRGKRAALTQQALVGLGGIGKTQLALEYSHRYADRYDVVWWIRAQDTATLINDLAELAEKLGIVEENLPDQMAAVNMLREHLCHAGKWLLVFDNAKKPEDLKKLLPNTGDGHMVITSLNPAWGSLAEVMTVGVMKPREAEKFILQRTRLNDRKAAAALAKELGYFPLALEQAGAYIEKNSITIEKYIELFQEYRLELFAGIMPLNYEETVATTWELSFKALDPGPADLLNLCAYFAPDNIPLEIIREGRGNLWKPLASLLENELETTGAIGELRKYSLIQREGDLISIHRLVQEVIRARLDENLQKKWADAALRIVNDPFPRYVHTDIACWPLCALLLDHAMETVTHAEKLDIAGSEASNLLTQAALFLQVRARFTEARDAFEPALGIAEKVHGPEHENVAAALNNFGFILLEMGERENAKVHFERALWIDEKVCGKEHPNVAIDINNLGRVLHEMGEREDAKVHFERALRIVEKAYGKEHPQVAIYLNNLGALLHEMGEREDAKMRFERALRIGEKIYGKEHPQVAMYVGNLGRVLHDMGEREKAREHIERALKIFRKFFDEDHPRVVKTRNFLESL